VVALRYNRGMSFSLHPVAGDEFDRFARAEFAAFAEPLPAEEHPAWVTGELDRTLAAFEGDEVVGTGRIYSLELTLPGGAVVPTAAVSAIGVLPTHRRRGILTAIMRQQLDDAAARGESTAVLTASEGTIYRRFGYGAATAHASFDLDRRHSAFLPEVTIEGRCRLIDEDDARKALPEIFERARRRQPGAISRPDNWWPSQYFVFHEARVGSGPPFHVVHEATTGEIDGYVTYSVEHEHAHEIARDRLGVRDLVSTGASARRALWCFVTGVDLVETITAWNVPADEPLRWMLRESRRMRLSSLHDHLWVRFVDVAAALAARRYAVEGRIVVDVRDDFRPESGGRYQLTGGPDGAECTRTDATADLACSTTELASVYLGGVRITDLARAGLVDELTAGALARVDAMFAVDPLPFSQTWF
jgi:predicted acetyltransferase